MPDTSQHSSFAAFCQTAEAVRGTTKRLEKASLLAVYFSSLSDPDLLLAARYLAGYTFPLRDQRTTNIGGAALVAAIFAISGCDQTWLSQRLVALGDLGEAAEEAFAASKSTTREPSLTLAEVGAFFETLAATSGTKNKQEIVLSELAKATPIEVKYLVKLLAGDLRIGLQEGAVEDAIARWTIQPVGEVQWANMLTGDIGETAILARDSRLDTARMRLFHPIKFMLATAAADLADVARQMPEGFVVEDKFDGIRAQAHIAAGEANETALHGIAAGSARVALFSRTLDELTKSYPDLLLPLAALVEGVGAPADLILDGEILPVQGDLILPFLELQKRLGRKTLPEELLASVPVAFVAYDCLYANGQVLIGEPFTVRRALLESLNIDHARTRRADSRFFEDVAALDNEFEAARARGNEGLMVKDPNSPYKPGRRGRTGSRSSGPWPLWMSSSPRSKSATAPAATSSPTTPLPFARAKPTRPS